MRNKKILALILTLFFALGGVAEAAKETRKTRRQERRTQVKKNERKGQYHNKNLVTMLKKNRRIIRMAVKSYKTHKQAKNKLIDAIRMQKGAERVFLRKVKRPRQRRNYVIALAINARKLSREVIQANKGTLASKDKKDGPTALDIAKRTSISSLQKLLSEAIKKSEISDSDLENDDGGLGDDKSFLDEASNAAEGDD